MKHWMPALFGLLAFSAAAGEREDLLKQFAKEDAEANKITQNAMTTIELNASAGNEMNNAEKQLFRALDYKLRHTADPAKRLKLLEEFHEFSKKIKEVRDTPRDDMGSLAGMQIYGKIAYLMNKQIGILLLDEQEEKSWEMFANATLYLREHQLKLQFGGAEYSTKLPPIIQELDPENEHEYQMEIDLLPGYIFQYQGRFFAFIHEDLKFTFNNDFSTVYLCELKNNKLMPLMKCAFPYISKWTLQDNVLKIYYEKKVQTIYLAKPEKKNQ